MPNVLPDFHPPAVEWSTVAPIVVVILAGIVGLIVEMARPKCSGSVISVIGLIGLGVAGFFAAQQLAMPTTESFARMVITDRFGAVMQMLILLSAALTLLFSESYLKDKHISFGEFYPLILWSAAGGMMMVTTKNLLMVFVGLEVLSIALYVLAGLSRNEAKSEESAIKYFLLGAFASGFLLYGIALLYGASGSLHLDDIARSWDGAVPSIAGLALMGLAMALVGLGFKSAFVPFHQWTPDVYQGAPTNVTAFMAAGSKVAAIATLFRFLDACAPMHAYWGPALFWIAIATMTVGNLVALVQRDVKRILAYSSIAHAGYLLVGVLAHGEAPKTIGWGSVAYYLLSYVVMTIGAFGVISLAAKGGAEGTRLADLNGLWRRSPLAAVALIVFMFSLVGIPPTAGFAAKFFIFSDAVTAKLWPLAIVLAVNSALSCYYYLGIALAAFVNEPDADRAEKRGPSPGLALTTAICAASVIAVSLFATPISDALFGPDRGVSSNTLVLEPSTVAQEIRR